MDVLDQDVTYRVKLYSLSTIMTATFLGSPLAAGFLMRKNYLNLGQAKKANTALILGILVSAILLVAAILIPVVENENLIRIAFIVCSMGVSYLTISRVFASEYQQHEEKEGKYYSAWRGAGIGLLSGILAAMPLVGYIFYEQPNIISAFNYETAMIEFSENENRALQMYTHMESSSYATVATFIQTTSIPAWERNVAIMDEVAELHDLDEGVKQINVLLAEYCQLRLEECDLFKRAYTENTNQYDNDLARVQLQLNNTVSRLDALASEQ